MKALALEIKVNLYDQVLSRNFRGKDSVLSQRWKSISWKYHVGYDHFVSYSK